MQRKLNSTTRPLAKISGLGEGRGGRNHERTMDMNSRQLSKHYKHIMGLVIDLGQKYRGVGQSGTGAIMEHGGAILKRV